MTTELTPREALEEINRLHRLLQAAEIERDAARLAQELLEARAEEERSRGAREERMIGQITNDQVDKYTGFTCRCGCKQQAVWLTLCRGWGELEPTFEACCGSAMAYLSEACAEIGQPFAARRLPERGGEEAK